MDLANVRAANAQTLFRKGYADMDVSSVSFSSAAASAMSGYNRAADQMAGLIKSIASGDGDLVENVIELDAAQAQAEASLFVFNKSMDFAQSTIDILA